MLARIKNILLNILFPEFCVACNSEGSMLCEQCASMLPPLPPCCIGCALLTPQEDTRPAGHTCKRCRKKTLIRVFISPFPYRHPTIQRLIHEFKYRRIRSISPLLAKLVCSYLRYYRVSLPPEAILMPIPLHPRKERVRGFNQALLLAQDIHAHVSIPLDTRTLIRTASTAPQTTLSAENRRANVQHIFSLRDQNKVRGKTIILVDDVKTTGATLEQAARVLKQAGAKEIWAITFAH